MNQTVRTDHVGDYLAAVRAHLSDLDEPERAEVLAEVTDALRETAAEHDGPLEAVLGPADEYAQAYLSSAGLDAVTDPRASTTRRRRPRLRRAAAWSAGALLVVVVLAAVGAGAYGAILLLAAVVAVAATRPGGDMWSSWRRRAGTLRDRPWWPRAAELARQLRPFWWGVRGATLAAVTGLLLGLDRADLVTMGGLVLLAVGVVASTRLADARGLTEVDDRTRRRVLIFVNLAAVLAALVLWGDLRERVDSLRYAPTYEQGFRDGRRDARRAARSPLDDVTNIYPFDRTGRPLSEVLLYDQQGRPVSVAPPGTAASGLETDFVRDADGTPIPHLYPLQQYAVAGHGEAATAADPTPVPDVALPPTLREPLSR